MGAYKDFDADRQETIGETIDFKAGGEEFSIPTPIPSISFLDMLNQDVQLQLAAFGSFIKDCFGEENENDYKRFKKAATKARYELKEISGIVQFIVEEGLGRPLEQQLPSDAMSLKDTHSSLGVVSVAEPVAS